MHAAARHLYTCFVILCLLLYLVLGCVVSRVCPVLPLRAGFVGRETQWVLAVVAALPVTVALRGVRLVEYYYAYDISGELPTAGATASAAKMGFSTSD